MKLLRGKTAVITGCLQGIGKATLEKFAEEGADVFACVQGHSDEFASFALELGEKCGVEIVPIAFDFADDSAVQAAARSIHARKKPVHALVNIAGMTQDALFSMVTQEQLRRIFQINFFSQIAFSQYIVKIMLKNGGAVVNTSSITALDGNAGQLAYGAAKAAWFSATKTMSAELGPKGIRVNAIAPGVIDTAMTQIIPEEIRAKTMANCDLGRLGKPGEVASVVAYLASDRSSHISGQIIRIDGGIG